MSAVSLENEPMLGTVHTIEVGRVLEYSIVHVSLVLVPFFTSASDTDISAGKK